MEILGQAVHAVELGKMDVQNFTSEVLAIRLPCEVRVHHLPNV